MIKKLKFRKIIIPGYMLEDGRLDADSRETYGKISRLAFGKGYCWPSNSALDGTESGRTASRHIKKLEEAGYIKTRNSRSKKRKIIVTGLSASGESAANPVMNGAVNPATSGDVTPPYVASNPATSGERTVLYEQVLEQVHEQEMKSGNVKIESSKSENAENGNAESATGIRPEDKPLGVDESRFVIPWWHECCVFWNGLGISPECRYFLTLPSRHDRDIVRTFRGFSLKEIKNAITNYSNHRKGASGEYEPPFVYGSLGSFLANGVQRYFDDSAIEGQFKSRRKK
jgi:DNA-binding MarR family transcriptional regulator